ncbi:sugar phosphate isomerase/epimerase family protein [Paraburkholderia silviterrae]|uniref:Sugar phosphate isomerase/epimerase n=1 Tax=Paraburkholderia silviterrae TaxID=2528715 RepID=A0A4R5MFF4_9BURK|nr:TIM barrel protein [Paraburkholderia silviterrae]TDG25995.1 sugar phosphate isomerase/epimerase [Paraburkholderia silviterrae]
MKLELFRTFWGFSGDPRDVVCPMRSAGFDGIEAQVPQAPHDRERLGQVLEDEGFAFIAEVTTGGGYVPIRAATPDVHLRDLEESIVRGKALKPCFFTVIAGCDAWPLAVQVEFFSRALDIAAKHDVVCSFETHRSRSMFNPWVTRDIVRAVPHLKLTCDFSHWVVVCERLLDGEEDTLAELVPHAHHVHARVGYPQGPQVPHPAAAEYRTCLEWHQRAWEQIWAAQRRQGYATTTMTPEFGPDGYLHTLPFTHAPVADLWEINAWMAAQERQHYDAFLRRAQIAPGMTARHAG